MTTCSSRNFELVKSLGAAAAFDYKDPDCAAQIRTFTHNDLKYVWDTISLPATAQLCADVISPGGRYGAILTVEFPRKDVKCTNSLGYTAAGEAVKKGSMFLEASTEDFEFAKKWAEVVDQLLEQRKLKVHPPKIGKGLENVLDGCDLLRKDKVSGQKLVYVL